MRGARAACLLAPLLAAACASDPDGHTLAELRDVEPDMNEVRVEQGLEQAMQGYAKYLAEAPESSLTPEAMRRLADLKLEKEYGLLGDGELREMPAPEPQAAAGAPARAPAKSGAPQKRAESDEHFEKRAAGSAEIAAADSGELQLPGGQRAESTGPLEAIALYDKILAAHPDYQFNDQVLYQKSRAYDELGRTEEAIAVMDQLIARYPQSRHIDEVQFRRGEYFFTRKKWLPAEQAYQAVTAGGAGSEYYELALYKLGWTFYKQEMHEEALGEFVALLDHKVATGYDFDQKQDEDAERRIADTFRVVSLSFSNLGGPEVLGEYFEAHGKKSYEDRIYSHLGEFHFEKLRYQDAAKTYQAFVDRNPLHRSSPHFTMRVVAIYEAGGFPKLVLESKKQFAASYGLSSEYWRHFDVNESPEVLGYLKSNLQDLAGHYHALYQNAELADEKPANFEEAARWYRAYLESFPTDPGAPASNHRLADLLLEHRDFGDAAHEYERTAYERGSHEKASAAGYAAIYAHREHQKQVEGDEQLAVRRAAVASTLRFVAAFPQHEHAATVLRTAVDDLYDMKDHAAAITTGQQLIDAYPDADPAIRRSAWTVVAHASFEIGSYPQAEQAYTRVLELVPADDAARQALVDNLAASIYKQGELANAAQEHRAAADHFLRIAQVAPASKIRPLAEYDASAALMRLKDWSGAAAVLDRFRQAYPDHELNKEATKQLAFVYREQGELASAAGEYERVAAESPDAELRRGAMLEAGSLYEKAQANERALKVYLEYLQAFPEPIEVAVETRFKVAQMYAAANDTQNHHEQLRRIVAIDAAAGSDRSARVRTLAARSALVLSEQRYHAFAEVALVQPFELSLKRKKQRMDEALDAFGRLVDYEVGDVTAAATFYMAALYSDFSQALMQSERPAGLAGAALQDYELALEEEAYPFEEQAIKVHEKNLELMRAGVFGPWIEKSLGELARLMPGRYAKPEASSGFIASIDTYAYQAPQPPAPAPLAEATPAESAAAVPAATPETEVPPAEQAAPPAAQDMVNDAAY
jgi:cellulose synthase operon protein C